MGHPSPDQIPDPPPDSCFGSESRSAHHQKNSSKHTERVIYENVGISHIPPPDAGQIGFRGIIPGLSIDYP